MTQITTRSADAARAAACAGAPTSERIYHIDLGAFSSLPPVEMVAAPPGAFLMGSPAEERGRDQDEGPQFEVRIAHVAAFGRSCVTFAQWDAARTAGAALHDPKDYGRGRGARPVTGVSWDDAHAFIAWLNERLDLSGSESAYRLPSEAEWEYACRAGATSAYAFGDELSNEHAHFAVGAADASAFGREDDVGALASGAYPENAFGLLDMHGNVWEWCADAKGGDYADHPATGVARLSGDETMRALRGGSWSDNVRLLRSANRGWNRRNGRDDSIGFRLARTLT